MKMLHKQDRVKLALQAASQPKGGLEVVLINNIHFILQ